MYNLKRGVYHFECLHHRAGHDNNASARARVRAGERARVWTRLLLHWDFVFARNAHGLRAAFASQPRLRWLDDTTSSAISLRVIVAVRLYKSIQFANIYVYICIYLVNMLLTVRFIDKNTGCADEVLGPLCAMAIKIDVVGARAVASAAVYGDRSPCSWT